MNSRPRVCFLTGSDADWGGASRVLYTMLRELDLDLVEPLVLLSGDGPMKPELEARGIRCLAWGRPTEPDNKFDYALQLIKTIRFFLAEKVDLLHLNQRFWRPAEVLAAHLLRIPVLVHFHVVNKQRGSFMDRCKAAICVSHFVANNSYPEKLRKEVIYNPISLARFEHGHHPNLDWGLSSDAVVIAFVGQIRDIKGVQDFISMAHQIPSPNAVFLIAGECRDPAQYSGSYSPEDLERLANGDPRIRYIGYRKDVENVYHAADIVVVPSRWQEPLGLINLEAGACRKPVVATRVGGIPEVIHDEVNGYLVESGDIDAMAAKVKKLIADPSLRVRMGDAGLTQVSEAFTTQPVRQFEELLRSFSSR